MPIEITKQYIEDIQQLIADKNNDSLLVLLKEVHYADIAEVVEELYIDEGVYLIRLLESDVTSEVIADLENFPVKKLQKK